MFLQYGAVISTIAVELVVATVVINFLGTLWGDGRAVVSNLPIRWFYTGMIFYVLTCFQSAALQVTLHVSETHSLHGLGRRSRTSGNVWGF